MARRLKCNLGEPWTIKSKSDLFRVLRDIKLAAPKADLRYMNIHVCTSEFDRFRMVMTHKQIGAYSDGSRGFDVEVADPNFEFVTIREDYSLNGTNFDPTFNESIGRMNLQGFDCDEGEHDCHCDPSDLWKNGGCTCRPGGQKEVPWALEVYGK